MIPRQDSQVLDLVVACTAAVCTIVADKRAITEKEEVGVGVEERPAGVASEAVQMPSVSGCGWLADCKLKHSVCILQDGLRRGFATKSWG